MNQNKTERAKLDFDPEDWRKHASEYEKGFVDGMQKQMHSSVDKAVNRMSRPAWANLIQGVRVDGDTVVIKVKNGNDAARELCGALIEEMNK